jgi:hypothetical protein
MFVRRVVAAVSVAAALLAVPVTASAAPERGLDIERIFR